MNYRRNAGKALTRSAVTLLGLTVLVSYGVAETGRVCSDATRGSASRCASRSG
jgi:hypothetical protein